MSDVLNLLCDYAAAGAVVDRSLIAKVESEIARLYAAAGASEIARLTERLAAAEAERDALFERTKHDIYVSLGVGQKLTTAEQKLQEIYTAASCIVEKQAQLGRSKSGLYPHFDAQWVCRTIKPVEGVVE